MSESLLLALTIAGGTASAVLGALLIFAGVARHRTPPIFAPEIAEQDAVFVFRDTELVDASDRGRKLLSTSDQGGMTALEQLLALLEPRFASLRDRLGALASAGRLELAADDGTGLSIIAQMRAGLVHLRVVDPQDGGALIALDRLSYQAMQDELATLRNVARAAPMLVWAQDSRGQIVWANDAYIDALSMVQGGKLALGWPLPTLFKDDGQVGKLVLAMRDRQHWYSHRVEELGGKVLNFATPIDSAVQSELARREMMQMLTRTFASLPIGLALFDADRRLQVFNPALVDLTGLDPFFLAARPDLGQVLHTLREMRMLPEPKDFTTWRDELLRLETAAANGTYREEWVLPDGCTYQVSGCPQPNGALAFFIQDITSEATLLRGIRAEGEFTEHVLNALPDAVVAFDRNGQTALCNSAYAELWGADPCVSLFDAGFDEAHAIWARASDPGSGLAQLAEYVTAHPAITPLSTTATLREGGVLAIWAQHLPGGGAMVWFRPLRPTQSATMPVVPAIAAPAPRWSDVATNLLAQDMAQDMQADMAPARPPAFVPRARGVRHAGSRLRV